MKSLLIVASACMVLVACTGAAYGQVTDELHISVRLTTGERSRDSSSQTTTITVGGNAIVWEQTFSGRRRVTPVSRKELGLSPPDKEGLRKLIKSNDLLVTNSLEVPQDAPVFYFRIAVDLALDGEKGSINISGPRTAVKVKEEKLYQNSLALVKELYRIMNNQDKSVRFAELIHEPVRQ